MISIEDIRSLATLARLKLAPEEEAALQKDISNILEYVGQVSAVEAPAIAEHKPVVRNVMRDDIPYEGTLVSGKREALVAQFPKREGDYNVVRKIIQKDE